MTLDAPKAIIKVEGFRAAHAGTTLVENLTFDVMAGEVFVIAGGCGWVTSTMLKHMIGLYRPAAGRILIDGDDIHAPPPPPPPPPREQRQKILRKFGVAYQSGALFGNMTVLQNVRLPLEEYTDLDDDMLNMVALTKLRLVNIEHAAQQFPSELTTATRKRAAMARAMALDPAILFLDEPFAALDPIAAAELDELIVDLNRTFNVTFVIVTHELASIFRIADRVIMLDPSAKTMVALDDPRTLRDSSPNRWVRDFFARKPGGNRLAASLDRW